MDRIEKKESVSIITPAYNSARFIAQTIRSVKVQAFENWEMIIVDDCSFDETCEIVQQYAANDKRISLFKMPKKSGPAAARNLAIERAQGRYIAFLDSDDIWAPQKLSKQVDFMKQRQAVLSFTGYHRIDESDDIVGRAIYVPESVGYNQLLDSNVIGCLTAMYDTHYLGKVYMPLIERRQDYGLWLRILKKGHIANGLNETLAYLRIHRGSLSSNKILSALYVWKLYRNIEKLPLFKSLYHFAHYAYRSLKKYGNDHRATLC